jgi:hypothetical protein
MEGVAFVEHLAWISHDGFVKAVFPPRRNVAFLILYASRPREQCVRAHRAQSASAETGPRFFAR